MEFVIPLVFVVLWVAYKIFKGNAAYNANLAIPDSRFDTDPSFNDELIDKFEAKRNPEMVAKAIEEKYKAIETDIDDCEIVVKTELQRLNEFRRGSVAKTIKKYEEVTKHDKNLVDEYVSAENSKIEVTHNLSDVKGVTKSTRKDISGSLGKAGAAAGNAINQGHPAIAAAGVLVSLIGHGRRKRKALEKLNNVRGEVDIFAHEAVGVIDTLKEIRIKTRELYDLHVAAVKNISEIVGEQDALTGMPLGGISLEEKRKLITYGEQLKRLASIELK